VTKYFPAGNVTRCSKGLNLEATKFFCVVDGGESFKVKDAETGMIAVGPKCFQRDGARGRVAIGEKEFAQRFEAVWKIGQKFAATSPLLPRGEGCARR